MVIFSGFFNITISICGCCGQTVFLSFPRGTKECTDAPRPVPAFFSRSQTLFISRISRSQTLFGNAFNDAPRHIRDKPNMMTSEKLKYNAERCEKNQFQETTDRFLKHVRSKKLNFVSSIRCTIFHSNLIKRALIVKIT